MPSLNIETSLSMNADKWQAAAEKAEASLGRFIETIPETLNMELEKDADRNG